MAHLQLQLISGSTAGQSDACKFTSLGGTIGRSAECDWTLNDTDRYISNKHIAINFQNNQFVLTDTSSNGVFINDAESPLGKGNTYILRANDKLSLGKFSVQVIEIVSQETPSAPPISAGEPSDLLGLVTGQTPSSAATNSPFETAKPRDSQPPFESKHSQTSSATVPNQDASSTGDNLGLFDILSGSAEQTPSTQPASNPFSQNNDNFASSSLHASQSDTSNIPNQASTSGGFNANQTDTSGQSNFTPSTGFSPSNNTIPEDWDLNSVDADDEPTSNTQNSAMADLFDNKANQSHSSTSDTSTESVPDFLNNSGQQNRIPDDDILGEPAATEAMQPVAPSVPDIPTQAPIPQAPSQPAQVDPVSQPAASVPTANHTQSTMATGKDDAFFETLYEKLGLPKEYIASVDKNKFADELVEILMASTQGIMSLLAGRSVFKQESRLNMTMIKPQSNNPIKFSLDPSDTLEMLLVKKKPGYMTAKAAYSEALNDIQLHQMAFLSGLQATLSGVLGELNPDDIEQTVTKKGKSLMGLKAGTQKWEAFKEQQDILSKRVNENLNEILSTHFSDAYEAQINSLKNK